MAEEMGRLTPEAIIKDTEKRRKRSLFLSLRFRLLLIFTLLFAAAMFAAFLWFSNFATDLAFQRLRDDLKSVALTTANDINGDEHTELYGMGKEGTDTSIYLEINERLRYAKWNNPKAFGLYTLVPNPDDPESAFFVVSGAIPPDVEPTARDTELLNTRLPGCEFPPSSRPPIGLEFKRGPGFPDNFMASLIDGFQEANVMSETYKDQWGTWLSAFAPIKNSQGQIVGVLGVDACAADIDKIEEDIRNNLLVAMLGAFLLLTGIITLVSYSITRPIAALTNAAAQIGAGDYTQDLSTLTKGRFDDEVTKLADVFDIMIGKVAQREESLKKKVASLQIIIDEGKRDKQVEELTENEFFKDIRAKAEQMRKEKGTRTSREASVDKEEPPKE